MGAGEQGSASEFRLWRCLACGAINRVRQTPPVSRRVPICGECRTPLFPEGRPPVSESPRIATDQTFEEVVKRSPLPVLLDCWAGWCGPCLMIAPIIDQLSSELAGRVRVAKLNVDENPRTASDLRITSLPTILILSQGRELRRLIGALPREAVLQELARLGIV